MIVSLLLFLRKYALSESFTKSTHSYYNIVFDYIGCGALPGSYLPSRLEMEHPIAFFNSSLKIKVVLITKH